MGLAASGIGTTPSDVSFAIRLQSGVAEVRESGAYMTEIGFTAGDTFTIAVNGGSVTYAKNGSVFYTSGQRPSYPALVDTSLFDDNATLWNVVISGAR